MRAIVIGLDLNIFTRGGCIHSRVGQQGEAAAAPSPIQPLLFQDHFAFLSQAHNRPYSCREIEHGEFSGELGFSSCVATSNKNKVRLVSVRCPTRT